MGQIMTFWGRPLQMVQFGGLDILSTLIGHFGGPRESPILGHFGGPFGTLFWGSYLGPKLVSQMCDIPIKGEAMSGSVPHTSFHWIRRVSSGKTPKVLKCPKCPFGPFWK